MQLIVKTPGTFITQRDECFHLKQKKRTLDISPAKVGSLFVTNQATISTQALALAQEYNINVIFIDGCGDPIGLVRFAKKGSIDKVRRRQTEAANGPLGLRLVIDLVERKLKNQERFLKKLMHARPGKENIFSDAIERIGCAREDLGAAAVDDLEIIRYRLLELEETAEREYFQCLCRIIPKKYHFQSCSLRLAKDPFNACLNYCNGMLYSLVEKTCILAGLDPCIGLLHTDNFSKKSLAFDLIEPFRIYSERTVVYLFTGKKIRDELFNFGDNTVSLNRKGKLTVIEAMNRHLDETIRYQKRNIKRRHIIQHESHRLANILLSNTGQMKLDWMNTKEI